MESGPQRNMARTQLSPFRRESVVQVLQQVRCLFTLTSRHSLASSTNKCVMPVLSFAVISGGSRAGTYLSCPEVMIGTGPGYVQNLVFWILIRSRKRQEPCFFFDFDPVWKEVNASDMTGGTVHTEVNVSAPSRGFTGVRVCSKVRACVFPEECVCVRVCPKVSVCVHAVVDIVSVALCRVPADGRCS